jgi:hypothetical protein
VRARPAGKLNRSILSTARPAREREANVDDRLLYALSLRLPQEELRSFEANDVAVDLYRRETRLGVGSEFEVAEADYAMSSGTLMPWERSSSSAPWALQSGEQTSHDRVKRPR